MAYCSKCRGEHVPRSHKAEPTFFWHVLLATENYPNAWILQDVFETRQEAAKYAAKLSRDPYYRVRIVRKRKLGPLRMSRYKP